MLSTGTGKQLTAAMGIMPPGSVTALTATSE